MATKTWRPEFRYQNIDLEDVAYLEIGGWGAVFIYTSNPNDDSSYLVVAISLDAFQRARQVGETAHGEEWDIPGVEELGDHLTLDQAIDAVGHFMKAHPPKPTKPGEWAIAQ